MRPTRVGWLVALAVVAGVVGYVLTRTYYAQMMSPPAYAPLWLLLLALAEAYTASSTHARLRGRHGTKPMPPLLVPRLAALAKASSVIGAVATGGYVGFVVYVAHIAGPQAHTDTRTGALGIGCSVALAVAALVLEVVCRVKRPPGDDEERGGRPPSVG
jgi:hypothetical protein